ncbi:MAG: hypothetical protein A2V89_01585 [Gammaproteobacteria bacterium RBG_16_37_9]|nr:MAG: hypothetical protein A2V89_01585 [Gammaproteobacteria bacterium RBG_16_37_9]
MLSKNKNRGFTLIEMVIVIIVTLIVVPIAATILSQEFQIYYIGQNLTNADWQGRIALDRITRDIRAATNITTANANSITFTNTSEEVITYNLGGTNNTQLIYSSATSTQPLANNVQGLTFVYYGFDGVTQAVGNSIRYITITLNIVNQNANFNLKTAVYAWNIAG